MRNPFFIKFNFSRLETPFVVNQVKGHLVFGPLTRHISFASILFAGGILNVLAIFWNTPSSVFQVVTGIFDKLIFLVVAIFLMSATRLQQAIIGWITIKISLGLAAFIMATVGAATSFSKGYADAWPNLLLGLIWLPTLEFIPSITPYQKYVTLGRLGLSLPLIYLGIKSGNWHWS